MGRSRVFKIKEQMFEFSIPKSNFDNKVRKTSSTCLNAKKLTCNMNNIIDFNRYCNYDKALRITWIAWILFYL